MKKTLPKIISVYLVMMLVVSTAFAQNTINLTSTHAPSQVFFLIPHNNGLFPIDYASGNKSIVDVADGSQFYEEEFRSAKISGSTTSFEVRYNAFLDEMEVKHDEGISCINKNLQKHRISFTSENLEYKVLHTGDRDTRKSRGYFRILQENEYVSLYKKEAKKLALGLEKTPYMTPAPKTITEFQDVESDYYIEFENNGIATKLSKTRRGVSKLFKGKEEVVLKFIKKNRLDVTNEEDLQKLFNYINSL
jgi:hypothetical protein